MMFVRVNCDKKSHVNNLKYMKMEYKIQGLNVSRGVTVSEADKVKNFVTWKIDCSSNALLF